MAFGIEIYDENGNKTYDSTDTTWVQAGYFDLPESGGTFELSQLIPDGVEYIAVQLFVNVPSADSKMLAHNITFDTEAKTMTASGGSDRAGVLVLVR